MGPDVLLLFSVSSRTLPNFQPHPSLVLIFTLTSGHSHVPITSLHLWFYHIWSPYPQTNLSSSCVFLCIVTLCLCLCILNSLTCPQSWRGSPASLQLSQSPYSCPSFAISSQCLCNVPLWRSLSLKLPYHCWSFPKFCGVSQTSAEPPSLPQSSPVVAGVPPTSPEFLLLRWSSCFSLGAPCPQSSSQILCEASPVFQELSYYLLWHCYCIIALQFHSFTPMLSQSSP